MVKSCRKELDSHDIVNNGDRPNSIKAALAPWMPAKSSTRRTFGGVSLEVDEHFVKKERPCRLHGTHDAGEVVSPPFTAPGSADFAEQDS